MQAISSDWIDWGADEHPELTADDFDWVLEPEFPIVSIGGQRLIDELFNFIDYEISGLLEDYGYAEDVTPEEVAADGDGRLAGWIQLDKDVAGGQVINEPVQIALVNAPDADYPRSSICDGWHRIATVIKYGGTTIPAYVGRLKKQQ